MKRQPDKVEIDDFAYYATQLDINLDLFKEQAPRNDLVSRVAAQESLLRAAHNLAALNIAYARELSRYQASALIGKPFDFTKMKGTNHDAS